MIKSDNNSARYEIEPCQLIIPAVPFIAGSEDFSDTKHIQISGVTTLETSAKLALRLADDMLRPVREDLRKGRCTELLRLLETRPEFSAHPWVRQAVLKWIKTGRSFTKRGRRFSSFEVHPLIVAALVDELIARQWAPNKEQSFVWLADRDWLEYESAKKQYYQALSEERFRAVLIQGSIWSTPRRRLKSNSLIGATDPIRSGKSATRLLCEDPKGRLTATITAT